ncbi:hypothetical protein CYY_009608 [Polysphondylium violaceum]|uniref:G-patch domain-containing protein n=1 Tax=Polysphondylium violaceum TaxID=133409 RepID=A0A8J4PTD3_9MYCE|nr:hypothetical protein CYY_009608 [Polysphondylium violaceum]
MDSNNSSNKSNDSFILIDGIAISTSFGKKKKAANHDASSMFGSNSFIFAAPTSPTLNNSCEGNEMNNNNSGGKEQQPPINQHSKQQKNKFKRNKKKDKLKRKKNFQNNLPPKKSNTTLPPHQSAATGGSIHSSHNAQPIDKSLFYDSSDQSDSSDASYTMSKGKLVKKTLNPKEQELLMDYISHVSDDEDKDQALAKVLSCNFTFEEQFDKFKISKHPKNNKKKKNNNNNNNCNNNNSNNNNNNIQQQYSEDEEEIDLDMGSYKKKCRLQRIQSRNQQRKKRSIDSKYSKKIAFVKGNILNDQEPLDETNTFSPPLLPKRVSFQLPKESDVIILSSGNEESKVTMPVKLTTTTTTSGTGNSTASRSSILTSNNTNSSSSSSSSTYSLNSSTSTLENSNVSTSPSELEIILEDDSDDDSDLELYDYDSDESDDSAQEDYSYQFQSEEDFEDEMDTDSDVKETFTFAMKNIFCGDNHSDIEGYDSLSESEKSSSSTTNTSGRLDDDDDDDDDDDNNHTIRGCYINSEPSGDEFFTNPFKPKVIEKPKQQQEVIEISDDYICIDDNDGDSSSESDLTDQETVRKGSFFDWIAKVHGPKIVIPDKNKTTGQVQELIDVDQFDSFIRPPPLNPSILNQPYSPSKPILYPFISECIESNGVLRKDILDLYEKGLSISSYSIKELTSIAQLFDNIILHRYTNEFPLWPMAKLATHQVEFLAQQYSIFSTTRKVKEKPTIFILVNSNVRKPSNKKKDSYILAAFTESGEYSVHNALFNDPPQGKRLVYSSRFVSNNKSSPKNKSNTRRGSGTGNGGKKKSLYNNKNNKKKQQQQQAMDPKINTVKHGDIVAQDVAPLSHTNVGNILLKRMGWQGGGLGSIGQGLDEPIQAIVRKERFGLGFS